MADFATIDGFDGRNGYFDGEELRIVSYRHRTYLLPLNGDNKTGRIYRVFDRNGDCKTARAVIMHDKSLLEKLMERIKIK